MMTSKNLTDYIWILFWIIRLVIDKVHSRSGTIFDRYDEYISKENGGNSPMDIIGIYTQ